MPFKIPPKYATPARIECPDGTIITTRQGKKGPDDDFKIYTQFPYQPFPHSMFYAGAISRLKAWVEDINYPPEEGKLGRKFLFRYLQDCIFINYDEDDDETTIFNLCKKYQIPFRD